MQYFTTDSVQGVVATEEDDSSTETCRLNKEMPKLML